VCVLRTRLLLCKVVAGPKQQGSHPISQSLEQSLVNTKEERQDDRCLLLFVVVVVVVKSLEDNEDIRDQRTKEDCSV
jgi:hypothetical protein